MRILDEARSNGRDGTGIGGAAARRCLEEGARVVISDQHHRRLAAARAELARAHADRIWSQPCDVTDQAQVQALIDAAAAHFGRIDVLVNNAGLGGTAPVPEMTDEQWFGVLDVTLTGSDYASYMTGEVVSVSAQHP